MPQETLTCKVGHTWTRTRTRGRKPEYCPKHLYLKFSKEEPEEASQPPQSESDPDLGEESTPEPDGTFAHAAEAAYEETQDALEVCAFCNEAKAPHEFNDGLRCKACAEAQDEPQRDTLAKARQAKAEATATQAQETASEVEEILDSSSVPIELKLKLSYCQEQLALKRDPEDIKILTKRRELLINEARR